MTNFTHKHPFAFDVDVRQLAQTVHEGQVRSGGVPYFEHVDAVARIAAEVFEESFVGVRASSLAAACLLHDSVEDQEERLMSFLLTFPNVEGDVYAALAAVLNSDVSEAVQLVTNDPAQDEPGLTAEQKVSFYVDTLRTHLLGGDVFNDYAFAVKLGDYASNAGTLSAKQSRLAHKYSSALPVYVEALAYAKKHDVYTEADLARATALLSRIEAHLSSLINS